MVKLSSYSNGYDDGNYGTTMPWQFWTEEEKSQVIYQAYKDHYITSAEVKRYLDISRRHMFTQFFVPALAAYTYFGHFKFNLAKTFYRRSPTIGMNVGIAFVAVSTILWVNLSPFYLSKQKSQQQMLQLLYKKIGLGVKMLNDLVPRTRTSTDIDVRTRMIYSKRNGFLSGTIFAQDDFAPPITVKYDKGGLTKQRVYL